MNRPRKDFKETRILVKIKKKNEKNNVKSQFNGYSLSDLIIKNDSDIFSIFPVEEFNSEMIKQANKILDEMYMEIEIPPPTEIVQTREVDRFTDLFKNNEDT